MNNSNAVAVFHSLRGEKSALVLVKRNPLEFDATPAYVPRTGIAHLIGISVAELGDDHAGACVSIPDNYSLISMTDQDGKVRTTQDGKTELKQLVFGAPPVQPTTAE